MTSPPDTHPTARLDEEAVEAVAGTLRALADPTRIRLIELLDTVGPASVGGLASSLPLTRQAVSRQLGVLHGAGIVRRRRDGMRVVYELRDWTGLWLLGQVADAISSAP
jgi:DNA-binding transcriptional ArsR family regulator